MENHIEAPIDPDLPIIDSHHHLFDQASDRLYHHVAKRRFLLDDYLEFLGDGYNVVASVAVQCRSMYRAEGPEELRIIGETEFLNGQAAMAATGLYGKCRVAAGIVGGAELRQGDAIRTTLEAHKAAGGARFKGIRQDALWDADPTILGNRFDWGPGLYLRDDFRRGLSHLAPLGLSFDAFVLAPQLPDVLDLAHSFPDLQIILNHLGNPVGIGAHKGRLEEEFPQWRRDMREIARCPNIVIKVGGLGTFLSGSPAFRAQPPANSASLAAEWRPYAETAVELFGADRSMFESNVPTDGCASSFTVVCNAYHRIFAGCSREERQQIFAGTAARIYGIDCL
jgi:predicted TIM-barrel fold metal-dependent hydrolase